MIDFTIVAPTGMFKTFRAQFGMDNEGNYRQQSLTNMQKAVYNGKMSVVDYYERQVQTVYTFYATLLCPFWKGLAKNIQVMEITTLF